MEGYIYKKSPSGIPGMRVWQKRYLVLDADALQYYRDGNDLTVPSGRIALVDVVSAVWLSDRRKGARFDIVRECDCRFQNHIFGA
jgi:hypothetical protein